MTVLLAVCLTLIAATAWGYWVADGADAGHGAAAASSVDQGATPTVSADGNAVTVNWAATTLANGQAVGGYRISRYDAATDVAQTVLAGCAGTLTTISCTETGVADGSWTYAVTPAIGDHWVGAESAKSAPVVVDATSPVNAVTLSSVSGAAVKSGTTVYYRGSSAGSLRLTNAVTDNGTGPASSATALSGPTTGWSHTPSTVSAPSGGPYESNAFAWAAGTTSSPQAQITGRDGAGNTALTTLGFVDDSTPPSAGTISYTDGFVAARSVSVSFTTGGDTGSGIATRRLQRAAAPLTGSTCGTFGSFSNLGAVDPTSPYVDSGLAGACYQYRYVVTDRVGNQHAATSASVAKVGYAGAVNATPGLLSHWRLSEAAATLTTYGSFTGTSGAALAGRVPDIGGGTWAHQAGSANAVISDANRVRRGAVTGYTIDYTSTTPATANYSVEADLVVKSTLLGDTVGVIGRLNTATTTFYMARWRQADTSWNLVKYANGTVTNLSTASGQGALTVNEAYRLKLEMNGTSLKLYVNGVEKVATTDGSLIAAGHAGIMDGADGSSAAKTNTTGIHLDNFQVTPSTYPRALDSKGSNHGDYKHGVTLGAPGALAGGSNSAAQFDGVNDHVQVAPTSGLPTGAAVRSTELWFKTSSAARQVLFSYGNAAATQEYGLWINAGGDSMTAWGWGAGNDKVFAMPAAVNNGAWHHVVQTYDGSSLTIYIDGVALPLQAATRATGTNMYGFGIGAVIRPTDGNSGGFFAGSIDEVSFYTTALNQQTVTDHYQLGGTADADLTGPTGGSVSATGLVGTGGAYSTSTTLSLTLAKGTDPSGLAATGAQLLRATATLTDGTCGTFGGYTLVAGGTDPVSPKTDSVADQACYSYRYVVADTLGNTTTYTSADVKVDTTAPTAPSLAFSAFTNTYWGGTGSTVYYRSAATAGAFTATAAATDAASGIASYAFPALGASWTSTPGAHGVTTYAWSGAPAAPGTKNVTATNNAGTGSTNSAFTLAADDTAPAAGTITYADTTQTSTSVTVSFTTGTDGGSGVGSRLLQRASATLTGSTCGTYGAFVTVSGGTSPTSPFVDTVPVGRNCFRYRYVVSDNVGNQHTASSANVVKVDASYLTTVTGTAGLVGYWRLGEATTSSDSMSGTNGAQLQSRTGEIAATWTRHAASGSTNAVITSARRVRKSGNTVGALYYTSAIPASANYTVEADVHVASDLTGDIAGVVGRVDPASSTYYYARYEQSNHAWNLHKVVNGTWSHLGTAAQALTTGSTYRLALDLTDATIRVLVDGVQVISVTDAGISAAGRGGVALGFHASATPSVTNSTGMHLDNFRVTPPLADTAGTYHGAATGGLILGDTGALPGDPSTAATFDGVNDVVSVPDAAALKPAAITVEAWVKPNAGLADNASVATKTTADSRSDGYGMYAWNGGIAFWVNDGANDVFTSALPAGSWSHVVGTYDGSTIAIYVNGALAQSYAYSAPLVHSSSPLLIGDAAGASNYHWAGGLDEVAVYSRALTAPEIAQHFSAGQ